MTPRSLPFAIALLLVSASVSALPPEQETEHVVESGETLNGIANRAQVSRERIIEANGLEDPYIVRVGQTLKIPRGGTNARRTIAARGPASSSASATYTVKPGESLSVIASREGVPRVLIAEANRLRPPYPLRPGQQLIIPRTRHHVVEEGDTGFGISLQYAVPWENIAVANDLDPAGALPAGRRLLIPTVLKAPEAAPAPSPSPTASSSSSRFAWPARGKLRRSFQPRGSGNYHDGLDILAPEGSAARATAAGKVIFAGKEPKQFGHLVVVDHGDGWHSAYGSLSRVTVKKGHTVAQGERVGLVGNTSITRKTELHFELRKDGKPVDPLGELPSAQ